VPDNPAPDVVARLWDEYKRRGTTEAREQLILHDSRLVPPSVDRLREQLLHLVHLEDRHGIVRRGGE
jgi:hypothetical protein